VYIDILKLDILREIISLLGKYFRVKVSSKKNEKSGSHASAFYRTVQSTTSYQRYDQKKGAGERKREREEQEGGIKGRRKSTYDLVNKLRLNYILFYLSCLRRSHV